MIILSNTCIGSFIYKIKNQKLNNPLCWSLCDINSLFNIAKLIKNHEDINISYKIIRSTINNNEYVLGIANNIMIHYVHYRYDNCDITTDENSFERKDIVGKNIIEYVNQHIYNRIKRIQNEKITIIIDSTYDNAEIPSITSNDIDIIYNDDNNLLKDYQIILVTNSLRRKKRYKDKQNFITILTNSKKPRTNANLIISSLLI